MNIFKLLRVNQWSKNILLFAPIFLAHSVTQEKLLNLALIFVSFSFICSSTYIFNDLIDLNSDKLHPTKKYRPIASGNISKTLSKIIGLFCLILGILIVFLFYELKILSLYGLYLSLNILYTFYFKKKFLIDIIFLVSFYILRIYIGSVASDTFVSDWLILFSVFFFMSLAFIKRANDVYKYSSISSFNRNYKLKDFNLLKNSSTVSGFFTVVIFIFYINSTKASHIYENTYLLYPIPIVLIIFFILLRNQLVNKEILDDPTMHVLLNRNFILLFLIISIFYFIA